MFSYITKGMKIPVLFVNRIFKNLENHMETGKWVNRTNGLKKKKNKRAIHEKKSQLL